MRGDVVLSREGPGLRAPSRQIFVWASELLRESGLSPASLSCIAYGAGPGSFTGVRLAASLAQSLGYAWNRPACPVSSLAAMASAALRQAAEEGRDLPQAVACALDARLGEIYLGLYVPDATMGVRQIVADALLPPEAVVLPEGKRWLAVGSGWAAWPDLVDRCAQQLERHQPRVLPTALDVGQLAAPRFVTGECVPASRALPNYLRDQVATARQS